MQYLDDALVAAGAVCITIGAWVVWPPAAWFVGGGFLIAAGVLVARSRG